MTPGITHSQCNHCADRHDGFYGSYASPCPIHNDDGSQRQAMTHTITEQPEDVSALVVEFEAWAASEGYSIRRGFGKQDDYDFVETRRMWFAWQAARRAPVVPVPQGLREAAQAVVDRWDTPLWKDVPATAVYIADLRAMLAAAPQPPGTNTHTNNSTN